MSQLEILLDSLTPATPGTQSERKRGLEQSDRLIVKLKNAREFLLPYKIAPVEISLGSPEAIARFFALSFVLKDKRPLEEVVANPMSGSGVYAIYYHGDWEPAYQPLSGSETPIYLGKADPQTTYAPDSERQGPTLHLRLREHVKSLRAANLNLADFWCRTAVIQSGMQYSVENFLIHFFRPIWNKEMGICHGLGKHGDSATTRANRRSPWDTMHPGRPWAGPTAADQSPRDEIVGKIENHLLATPPVPNRDVLVKRLTSAEG